ncbi:MAG: S-adenosylmethionine:tRNA ribosyltransferase-isomerase, partial [Bacteroidales bacterium]|nr:S-adenosylmethionine:tRNA ribosyltransferase-isomerase [Bacteroidales bacterium]
MHDIKKIQIDEYNYLLPEHRIARYPLAQRDASKLLVARGKVISEDRFLKISNYLPPNSLLVLNETKVVQARLRFQNANGAAIELFVLKPHEQSLDYQLAYAQPSPVVWNCLVGNSKRWKTGVLTVEVKLKEAVITLNAERIEKLVDHSVVQFSWSKPEFSFAEVLDAAGEIPLPPYLNRKAEPADKERYQTVFARQDGSVAAPTASLHFTPELMADIKTAGHDFAKITLHVGAGTFKPVSTSEIGDHQMHAEQIVVQKMVLQQLIETLENPIIAVGTTSMRSIESMYWFGVMLAEQGTNLRDLHLSQWFPYEEHKELPDAVSALKGLVNYLEIHRLESLKATTALMIAPGY